MSAGVPSRSDPPQRPPAASGAATVLRLPPPGKAPDTRDLSELRRFHLGRSRGTPLSDDMLPAHLAPFRDPRRVRHDYPLILDGDLRPRSLTELLRERAPEGARVIRDNLPSLERHARDALAQNETTAARAVVRSAAEQMMQELALRPETASATWSDIERLLAELPEDRLLSLTPETPLRLFTAVAHERVTEVRAAFRKRVDTAVEGLRGLLAVDGGKDETARRPQALQKTLGSEAGRFVDAEALAKAVGPHRGSAQLAPEQRARLQTAIAALDEYLARDDGLETVLEEHGDDAITRAGETFDSEAARLAEVLRALRLAELVLRGAYDPDRHDPLLSELDWQGFTGEELHVLPVVVAVTRAEELAQTGLLALSRLLLSGRPVHVLVLQSPARNPAAEADEPFASYRLELAYLAIAHREAWVQQSTAARPAHLLRGFSYAMAGTRAALHVVDTGLDADGGMPPLGAFLHAGAAIEGRAHPLFQYDPEAGETWARRLLFDHNPQPDADWPTSQIACQDDRKLALAFTFADFAMLEPALRDQFSLLPDEWGGDSLVPVSDYLALEPDAAAHRVPFVWVAVEDGALHRAAVRRTLVLLCRDRLRFWHTLQELAGVRNEHVREAVHKAREEAAQQAEREREELAEQHALEVQRVREEATGTAMQGLARMLLELDPLAPQPLETGLKAPKESPPRVESDAMQKPVTEQEPEPEAPEEPEEEEDLGFDEPWIETARCSSCNDCININPLLFVYDENKQARIGDPNKGTYAQLVQAAEKCPVRCIHPGKPQHPDEPNLEELVARAEPFNH